MEKMKICKSQSLYKAVCSILLLVIDIILGMNWLLEMSIRLSSILNINIDLLLYLLCSKVGNSS